MPHKVLRWATQWHPLIWSKMSTFSFRQCKSWCGGFSKQEHFWDCLMLNVICISWLPEFCFCSRMWWEIVPSFALITGIAMIPTLAGRAWNRAIHDGLPNRLVEGKKPFGKNTFQALLRSPHSHGDGLPQEGHAAQQAQLLADLCQVTNCLPTLVICIMSCSLSGRTSKAMAPSIGATT